MLRTGYGEIVTALPQYPAQRDDIAAANAGATGQQRRFRMGPLVGWVMVAARWALSVTSAQSIGVLAMPVAVLATA